MLKRFGASVKKRNMASFTRSTAIVSVGDQPETSEDDPAKAIEGNKVKMACDISIALETGLSRQKYSASRYACNILLSVGP